MGKIYQVIVNGLRGEKMTIDLCNTEEQFKNMTVLQLREKIGERIPHSTSGVDAGVDALRLIFADKNLSDGLLSDYGIQHKSVIHMVLTVHGGLTA